MRNVSCGCRWAAVAAGVVIVATAGEARAESRFPGCRDERVLPFKNLFSATFNDLKRLPSTENAAILAIGARRRAPVASRRPVGDENVLDLDRAGRDVRGRHRRRRLPAADRRGLCHLRPRSRVQERLHGGGRRRARAGAVRGAGADLRHQGLGPAVTSRGRRLLVPLRPHHGGVRVGHRAAASLRMEGGAARVRRRHLRGGAAGGRASGTI